MFQQIHPLTFFRCFMLNLGGHTESWTEPFTWSTRANHYNSTNHDQVQVPSHSKYSLPFPPAVKTKPTTPKWPFPEATSNQTPPPLCHTSLPDNSKQNPWDPQTQCLHQNMRCLSPPSYQMFFSYLSSHCNFSLFYFINPHRLMVPKLGVEVDVIWELLIKEIFL